MSINMNILNLFKKKPSEPEITKIESLLPEPYYVKISLEVEYLLGKQLYIYNTNYTIKTENEQLFNESKEKQCGMPTGTTVAKQDNAAGQRAPP